MTCLDPWPLGKWSSEVTHLVRKSNYPRQPDGTFFNGKQTKKRLQYGYMAHNEMVNRHVVYCTWRRETKYLHYLVPKRDCYLPEKLTDFFFCYKSALQRIIVTYCIELSVSRQFTCNILNHIFHMKLSSSDIRVPLMWTQDDHNKTKTGTLSLNGHFLIHNLVNTWW